MGRREDRSGAPRTAPRTILSPDPLTAASEVEGLSASRVTAHGPGSRGAVRVLGGRTLRLLLIGTGLVIAFWALGALSQARADVLPPHPQPPVALPALAHTHSPVALQALARKNRPVDAGTGARLLRSRLTPRTVTRPRPVQLPTAGPSIRPPRPADRLIGKVTGGTTRTGGPAATTRRLLAAPTRRLLPDGSQLTGGAGHAGRLAAVTRHPLPATTQRLIDGTVPPLASVTTRPLPITLQRLIADGVPLSRLLELTRTGLWSALPPSINAVRGDVGAAASAAVQHAPYSPPSASRIGCSPGWAPAASDPPGMDVNAPPPAGAPYAAPRFAPVDAGVPLPAFGPVASAPLRLKATGIITHGTPPRSVRVGPLTPVPAPVSGSSGSDAGGSKTSGGAGDVPRLRLPTCGLWSVAHYAPSAMGRNVADKPSFSPD